MFVEVRPVSDTIFVVREFLFPESCPMIITEPKGSALRTYVKEAFSTGLYLQDQVWMLFLSMSLILARTRRCHLAKRRLNTLRTDVPMNPVKDPCGVLWSGPSCPCRQKVVSPGYALPLLNACYG